MTSASIDLDHIQIAKPCDASWDDMVGDERARRCGACKLDVLNISALTREEAVELIQAHTGERTCVRLFRRHDGTVITKDCPLGAQVVRSTGRLATVGLLALPILILATWFAFLTLTKPARGIGTRSAVVKAIDKIGHTLGIDSLCSCQIMGYMLF